MTRTPELDVATLHELHAALASGASPAAALAAADAEPLRDVARQASLGSSLYEMAQNVDTGDPGADLLVRGLGLAEVTGGGALVAVQQAGAAVREQRALRRLLQTRTAQARGSAFVLGGVPLVTWLLLVALQPGAVRFYATPLGVLSAALALGLVVAGVAWAQGIVRRASSRVADPLVVQPPRDAARVAAFGVPALVVVSVAAGIGAGLLAAALAAGLASGLASRRSSRNANAAKGRSQDPAQGGAAEAVELVAVALSAGLAPADAVAAVAPIAPPLACPVLVTAATRLQAGWDPAAAFSGTGLAALGRTLAASDRWGAGAAGALHALAADLRADRRACAEEAAELVELALIFPTTLLTLPAFVLAVVPPLLWAAFTG